MTMCLFVHMRKALVHFDHAVARNNLFPPLPGLVALLLG